jgi:hypothetical protein
MDLRRRTWLGQEDRIREAMSRLPSPLRDAVIVPAETPEESARIGVALVREGKCGILMKGRSALPFLLRAVLDKENGYGQDEL